jgi:hypothetical protein
LLVAHLPPTIATVFVLVLYRHALTCVFPKREGGIDSNSIRNDEKEKAETESDADILGMA